MSELTQPPFDTREPGGADVTDDELNALVASARPYHQDGPYEAWYWGTKDDEPDPDGDEWRVPADVLALMPGKITYPDAKRFPTEEAANNALRDAVKRYKGSRK